MATLPPNFLFNLQFLCRRVEAGKSKTITPETLDAKYGVPYWSQIDVRANIDRNARGGSFMTGRNPSNESLFDFRIGWADEGLFITTIVSGKSGQGFASSSRLERADALRLCVDTRDIKDAHRGSRFCHKFLLFPLVGEEEKSVAPLAQWAPINRAKGAPSFVDPDEFKMASERRADGYAFSVFIPAGSLTGYGPSEFNRMGLHYVVLDSEHGAFALQNYAPLPMEDDPSLWPSFELVE